MSKKYIEIGELRENEDKSLYIKIYISKKDGGAANFKTGDTLKLEDPKAKYNRMIDSGKVDNVEKLIEERDNIPSYVKRRVTLVQGQ